MMNVALLLSGGIGSRIKSDIPKQYIEIKGQMMIMYSLRTLAGDTKIEKIKIVADSTWHEAIIAAINANKDNCPELLTKFDGFALPGKTRQLSIINGLKDYESYLKEDDIVLIHDAARPFVTETLIDSILEKCKDHDGVMPALPCKDTMYLCTDNGRIKGLLNRKEVVAGQAPEAFRFGPYLKACDSLSEEEILKINGSSEPAYMSGLDVVTIPADPINVKITTNEDLEALRQML